MLGFAPIASATLADEGRVAPITIAGVGEGITTPDWMNNGLEVTASLSSVLSVRSYSKSFIDYFY